MNHVINPSLDMKNVYPHLKLIAKLNNLDLRIDRDFNKALNMYIINLN